MISVQYNAVFNSVTCVSLEYHCLVLFVSLVLPDYTSITGITRLYQYHWCYQTIPVSLVLPDYTSITGVTRLYQYHWYYQTIPVSLVFITDVSLALITFFRWNLNWTALIY